ncbi:MAG: carboxypeptidase regulatory-like domain-containing protein [Gemmatimonadota bacterium]
MIGGLIPTTLRSILAAGSLAALGGAAPLALHPSPADAQVADTLAPLPVMVAGRLVEVRTELAVGDALLRLEPVSGPATEMRTAESGRFTFSGVPPGRYTLRVERLGYRPLEHALELGPGTETDLQIQLVPEALRLEPVIAVAMRRSRLSMSGFEERRRSGLGHYITRADIDAEEVLHTTAVLRHVPGLRLLPTPNGRLDVAMRSGCRPSVFVDGTRREHVPGITIDDLVLPDFIDAIEVYRDFVPVQFGSSDCGAVAIWTRNTVPGREPAPIWKKIIVGLFVITGLVFLAN